MVLFSIILRTETSFPNNLFKKEHPGDAVLTTLVRKSCNSYKLVAWSAGDAVCIWPPQFLPPLARCASQASIYQRQHCNSPEIEHKTITNTPKNCNVLRKHYLWTIYDICHEIFTCLRGTFSGSHSHILATIFFQLNTEQGGHLKREQNHQVTFIILLKPIICWSVWSVYD